MSFKINNEYPSKVEQKSLFCRVRWFYDNDVQSDRFFFIPSISENVAVNCQASNILVAIQKSLFTDTDAEFAANNLALNDRDCNATNGSNTFDFDITHGTCNTELTISKDEERVFYHNFVFDTKADPDDPEFDIICSYSSKLSLFSDINILRILLYLNGFS